MERLEKQFLTITEKINLAKTELEIYKGKIKNGKKVTALIDKYSKSFEEIKKKLGNGETGLNAILKSCNALKAEIEIVLNSANTTLKSIEANLTTTQGQVDQMALKFDEFTKIKEKIDHPDTGLEAILNKSDKTKAEIEIVLNSANTTLKSIEANLTTTQGQVDQMALKFDEFTKIKEKIDHPDTGLEAILNKSKDLKDEINAIKEQSKTLFTEIQKIRDTSKNYNDEIESLKKNATTASDKISEYEKSSFDAKNKIEKIYKITTDSSLANSFATRKKELYKTLIFWAAILIGSATFLIIELFKLQKDFFNNPSLNVGISWLRLTVTFPLFIIVTYAGTQYKKERDLLEKYAFKAATALSLESYTTLLMNQFGEFKEDIKKFVLRSIKMIYKEPYNQKDTAKTSLSLENQLGKLKMEASTKTENGINKLKQVKDKIFKEKTE